MGRRRYGRGTMMHIVAYKTKDGWTVFGDSIIAYGIGYDGEVIVATTSQSSHELTEDASEAFREMVEKRVQEY